MDLRYERGKTLTVVSFYKIFSCIIDHCLQQLKSNHRFLFRFSATYSVNENWEILNEKRRLFKKSGNKI